MNYLSLALSNFAICCVVGFVYYISKDINSLLGLFACALVTYNWPKE